MRKTHFFAILILTISFLAVKSYAQDSELSPFQKDILIGFDSHVDKISSLANEFPADKYDWRPAEGIRSVKDSFMHLASANFFLSTYLGKMLPEGINPRELEKTIGNKEEALKILTQVFEHSRDAINSLPASQLDDEVELFGQKATKRRVILIIEDHMSEHLGQLIAYARSTEVTPPWSKKSE
ncbi:MAG: DinB family protein [Melioribacteraceae bacterium]|nr:DinB family protein [Melioribacteraceae bacterium]MCF8264768.1 DinB family protein [Melioribacteraceae bacterium]MCF8413721.1 DinB family protein [Melioribacteraceae bacterium]